MQMVELLKSWTFNFFFYMFSDAKIESTYHVKRDDKLLKLLELFFSTFFHTKAGVFLTVGNSDYELDGIRVENFSLRFVLELDIYS